MDYGVLLFVSSIVLFTVPASGVCIAVSYLGPLSYAGSDVSGVFVILSITYLH
jgi:hypothetical protein